MFYQSCPEGGTGKNPRLAARMMRAYGEILDRALTYSYQHLLTEGLDEESSCLFLRLARQSMEHFHALGRLIRDLGGDPGVSLRLKTPRIDLSEDAAGRSLPVIRRMLRGDMQTTAEGITELESLSSLTDEYPRAARTLRRLIREEQDAYEALTEQYAKVRDSLL